MKRIKHVFGSFPSTPQNCIIYLTLMVEVNFLKIKWIMGVCDLNYWLVRADICLSATFVWIHNEMGLCSNYYVSPIWMIGWFTTWRESFLWSALTCLMSCISRLRKIQSNRWYVIIQIMFYLFYLLNLIVWKCIHFLCIDPIYIYIILSEWNKGSKEEQGLDPISNK